MQKVCNDCKVSKPVEEFPQRKAKSGMRPMAYCRPCQRERNKASMAKRFPNPLDHNKWQAEYRQSEKGRIAWIRAKARRKGLNAEEEEKVLEAIEASDGTCDICGRTPEEKGNLKGLYIDHCHLTLTFRGLLCSQCNTVLGNAHDDPSVLRAGIAYLEKSL